jgi:hypothetical protein
MIKVKINIGDAELEMSDESANLQDFVRKAGVLLDMDKKCGMCDSTELTVSTRVSKDGNKFTEFSCKKCGARRPWGTYKDGSGYFLKPWEPRYEKPEGV